MCGQVKGVHAQYHVSMDYHSVRVGDIYYYVHALKELFVSAMVVLASGCAGCSGCDGCTQVIQYSNIMYNM